MVHVATEEFESLLVMILEHQLRHVATTLQGIATIHYQNLEFIGLLAVNNQKEELRRMRQLLQRTVWSLRSRGARSFTKSSSSGTPQRSIKLCVLGGGNMAEAIISALSKSEAQNMADIVVFDVNGSRVEHLTATYGTRSCDSITEGMCDADVTLISVKPQNVESIGGFIQVRPKGLILSIVAGCTVDKLREIFKTDNIVRSMPNTPAMVMEAMTVWFATKETPLDQVGNINFAIPKDTIIFKINKRSTLAF